MSGGVVRGRIEITGTDVGVGALVVRLFDVQDGRVRMPLGSAITANGEFEIRYEREGPTRATDVGFEPRMTTGITTAITTGTTTGTTILPRPNLVVSVLAPESRSDDGVATPLMETEVRHQAAAEEWFLIRVDLSELNQRRIPLPRMAHAVVTDAATAAAAAETERDLQSVLRGRITEVRQRAVAETRDLDLQMDNDLRDRIIQHLTKVRPDMPQRKRFVAPGEDVDVVARAAYKEAIGSTINSETSGNGAVTYLALTPQEAANLGDPPDPAKVEALLRKKNPTPTLLREDPMALACTQRRKDSPFDPPPGIGSVPMPDEDEPPVTDPDAKVREMINSIRPPEDGILNGRPDQDTVSANIKNLRLSRGPADVPAFYDFHNLQIAFEHVWEDARAEGYLEMAKSLYRTAVDHGGDPRVALDGAVDPMRALAREVQLVRQTQARFAEPGLTATASMAAASNGMNGANGNAYMMARPVGGGIFTGGAGTWTAGGSGGTGPWTGPWTNTGNWTYEGKPLPGNWTTPLEPYVPPRVEGGSGPVIDPYGGYPFTVFAANSVNFGLLVTYRQRWEPVEYQVGRLVGTRTLAPKETITLTTRRVVKTSHNRKQIESAMQSRKDEASDTERDEAEIVSRAQTKTNFALTTQGSFDLGPLGEGTSTTSFGRESDTSSQETKKAFREAVRKSAQEFRDERKIELEESASEETETTEKHEINNPNSELALTYIFYELQRRYRVSEKLHRAIPVALVAQRVPRPEEVNEAWVMRYDWIIRRFLPDDSYRSALAYISTRATGDRVVLDELRRHMESLRSIVETLKVEIGAVRAEAAAQLAALQGYVERKAAIEQNEDSEGIFESAWEWAAGADEESRDAIRVLEEAARERYEKAARDEKDLRARLDRESTALQVATDAYTKAYADYSNQRLLVNRLIRHVQDYILHYMQGIWSYEQPDQQFLRHHTLTAPRLEAQSRAYTLTQLPDWPVGVVPVPGKQCYEVRFTTTLKDNVDNGEGNASLAELLDLGRPLGYSGNYIIYPLKKSNALTDYMLTPYLDAELGLRDPDGPGNWTLQEFSEYVQCLRKSLTPERFQSIEPFLAKQYQQLLADPLRDGEEITVPTQSLYMQMIVDPGKALEEFQEAHRIVDVMKVKAELRSTELDNLRRAKLILGDKLDDPNVESVKNVYYHGDTPPHDGDE